MSLKAPNAEKKEKYSTFFEKTSVAAGTILTVFMLAYLAWVLIWG